MTHIEGHEKNGPHDPWSWELWVDNHAVSKQTNKQTGVPAINTTIITYCYIQQSHLVLNPLWK